MLPVGGYLKKPREGFGQEDSFPQSSLKSENLVKLRSFFSIGPVGAAKDIV